MIEVTTLRDNTRTLLLNRPASLSTAEIAAEIRVSSAWINAFAKGKIKNPGVVTVESLFVFLTNFCAKKAN